MQLSRNTLRPALNPLSNLSDNAVDLIVISLLGVFALVAIYGLLSQDMYLCLESIFLAFIPYLIWSAYRRTGTVDVFAPDVGFPLAYVVYLFLGGINLPIQTQFGLTLPWIIWVYYIIGLIAYLTGVRLFPRLSPSLVRTGLPKHFWPAERFLFLAIVMMAIGFAARSIVLIQTGIPFFHANDQAARTVGAGGILGVLTLCAEAAGECMLLYLLVLKPKGLTRWILIAGMVLVALDGIAGTNRTGLLRPLIAGVVVFHYVAKRFNLRLLLLVGIFVGVFASLLGTFRDVSLWGEAREHSLEEQGFGPRTYWIFNGYEAVRLPAETFEMTLQQVPLISPYTYGTTSLAGLAALLPGHRPAPSEIVKNTLRLQFVGFGAAATILAPLWFDGGVVGIITGMFLFGLVSRFLYGRVLSSSNYVWILIYGWFVQNAFKAIKDDILPELGVAFVITLFIVIAVLASPSQRDIA